MTLLLPEKKSITRWVISSSGLIIAMNATIFMLRTDCQWNALGAFVSDMQDKINEGDSLEVSSPFI